MSHRERSYRCLTSERNKETRKTKKRTFRHQRRVLRDEGGARAHRHKVIGETGGHGVRGLRSGGKHSSSSRGGDNGENIGSPLRKPPPGEKPRNELGPSSAGRWVSPPSSRGHSRVVSARVCAVCVGAARDTAGRCRSKNLDWHTACSLSDKRAGSFLPRESRHCLTGVESPLWRSNPIPIPCLPRSCVAPPRL